MPQFTKDIVDQFRGEKLPVGWPWRLLLFSILLQAFFIFLYASITFGYAPYLKSKITQKEKEIEKVGASVKEEDRLNFVSFYSQLINLRRILDNHVNITPALIFLEQNTNKKVRFTSVDIGTERKDLRLNGLAASYETLVQQLTAFDQSPLVEKTVLENSKADKDGIRFSLNVTLSPKVFSNLLEPVPAEPPEL